MPNAFQKKDDTAVVDRLRGPIRETTSVVVNGRVVDIDGHETNHAQLVAVAHPGTAQSKTRAFTVAFSRGGSGRTEGFVVPGETIRISKDQEFYVAVAEHS